MKRISADSTHIRITFPYDYETKEVIKTIADRAYATEPFRHWTLPATPWHAQEILTKMKGAGFVCDDEVRKLYAQNHYINHLNPRKDALDLGLYPFQAQAVDFIDKCDGRVMVCDDPGCIAGSAEIVVNRAGGARRITLANLYQKFHGGKSSRGKTWDDAITSRTRSLCDDHSLRLNDIKDVIYQGKKETLRILTDGGKSIELTSDHLVFVLGAGWLSAESLIPHKDSILVNGDPACPICKTMEDIITYPHAKFLGYCKSCMYKYKRDNKWDTDGRSIDIDGYVLISGLWKHPHKDKKARVRGHRLVMEAHLNLVPLDTWVQWAKFGGFPDDAEFLGVDKCAHHIDGDTRNNSIQNLHVLSHTGHAALHANPDRLSLFMKAKYEMVVSVSDAGVQDVYDIKMESPYHSFVANSIVVHNCGKTVTSLGYIRLHDIQRVLVVAPASVIYKWQDECHRWLVDPDVAVVETSKKEIPYADILILSYRLMTLLKEELTQQVFDCIIYDEFHYIKNHKAQRTQAAKEIAIGNPYLLCLSGTPLLNRPIEMFEALHLLQPSSWPSRSSYGWNYCGGVVHTGKFKQVFQGTCNEDDLAKRVRSIMIRRLKQDVKDQLPELTRSVLPVDIEKGEYNRTYNDDYPNALTKLTALRYTVGMAKAKVAATWAENFLGNSEEYTKLVLYCHHLDVVAHIKDQLKKYGVTTITGEVPSKERDRRIKLYQNPDGPRVMIITSAGGEGIDLFGLDGVDSSNICFVEREWNSAREEQAEARLHRMGQDNAVVAWYLIARNTIDEDAAELIEEKRKLIGKIVGVGEVEASIVNDLLKRLDK